jgi:ribonuclease P protein component
VAPRGRFSREQRIQKRADFLEIQASGRRVLTPHFVLLLYARGRARPGSARLGVTVSSRLGKAVFRSRAKRVIREAFRATRELFPHDFDVVVILRRRPADLKLGPVVREWQSAATELERRSRQALEDRKKRESALAHAG